MDARSFLWFLSDPEFFSIYGGGCIPIYMYTLENNFHFPVISVSFPTWILGLLGGNIFKPVQIHLEHWRCPSASSKKAVVGSLINIGVVMAVLHFSFYD